MQQRNKYRLVKLENLKTETCSNYMHSIKYMKHNNNWIVNKTNQQLPMLQ
jgi:hypothetical protein